MPQPHWKRKTKAVLRWLVPTAALLFLGRTLGQHWGEVLALELRPQVAGVLGMSLGVTLVAHGWSGWAWSWILQALQQPVGGRWALRIYLKTNLWKYLPGNVWHFYGRLQALRALGVAPTTAILAVVLDPVLMAAAALLVGLAHPTAHWPWQLALLILTLAGLHPRCLNPLLQTLGQGKAQALPMEASTGASTEASAGATNVFANAAAPRPTAQLRHYPLKPLAAEVAFVVLRGLGFGLMVSALYPLPTARWPLVISRFSLAWLAGLVIPGAPGGLGVVEALAVPLLQDTLPMAVILGATALYRLMSTLAEALGAAAAHSLAPRQ